MLSNHYVIGADIGASNLRVGIADRAGKVLAKWAAPLDDQTAPEQVVQRIREGMDNLLERAGVSRDSLVAIAAGAPGVTDVDAGVVIATSYLWGWRDVPLRDLLEQSLQLPASVENDVKLAAIGESRFGAARGVRNFVFLAIGTGVGAGVFLNGELLHGEDWTAGEVGYLIVPGTPEAAAGFGEPGSLESVIGGEGIRAQWQRVCEDHPGSGREGLLPTGVFALAAKGDRLAASVLNRSALVLAYAVRNIALIVNSSLFVLGGSVGLSQELCDATNRILEERNERVRPRLVPSALRADAQLMGAVAMALDIAESRVEIGRSS